MIVTKCVAVLLTLAICFECRATVLYVRFTSNEIIIGADSKRTSEKGDYVCVCKISQIGDTFIASAGLAEYGAFDPREFAVEALSNSQSLVEARTKFEQLIEHPLIEVLGKLKVRNRSLYDAFKKGAGINFIFARFVDRPELVTTALTPNDELDGSISLVKNQLTLSGPVNRAKRVVIGVSKRVEAQLDRSSFWARGTVAAVQQLLEMSIQDNPEAGGPIDIVQLSRGSVRWYPREPECDRKSRRANGCKDSLARFVHRLDRSRRLSSSRSNAEHSFGDITPSA